MTRHEEQPFPALSDSEKLHTCQKSQLVEIPESQATIPDTAPEVNVIIIDGSAFVNALSSYASKTFSDYAKQDVLPSVKSFSSQYMRTDIVFDTYIPKGVKAETRSHRGKGVT